MNLLPIEFVSFILPFASLFSKRTWHSGLVLLVGTILAPGKRTVSAALRVMGLGQERYFQNYHRLLNRAVWSSRQASRILLTQTVEVFAPSGVLVMGIDDTIERRKGKRIAAKGIYRDPVRSSDSPDCQSQRAALVKPDAAGGGPVGAARLGTAVLHGSSTLRTIQPNAQPPTQEAHRLGTPDDGSSATVVARALNCRRG